MAAGLPIDPANEVTVKPEPEQITEMKSEDEEMSSEEMRMVKKRIATTFFDLEAEADRQKDRGQKAMYMGDAADYENVFKAASDGNQKKARKLYAYMDTAARDAVFEKGGKKTKQLVAKYLGIELNEGCGSPHSEDEEDTTANYVKGQYVIYKGEKYCVEVPDAQSDFVGIIPDELKDASEEKRNGAVDLVHASNLSRPEDEEMDGVECPRCDGSGEEDGEPCSLCGGSGVAAEDEEVKVKAGMAPREGETEITLSFEDEQIDEMAEPPAADYARASEALRKVNLTARIKPGTLDMDDEGDMKFDTDEHGKYVVRKGASKAEELNEAAEEATIWDIAPEDEDKDESPENPSRDTRKIIVPAEVKNALKKEIDELNKGVTEFKTRDPMRADFYSDTAAAMEDILDNLNKGTSEELKKAQILASSLMGPMVQRIPNVAYEFIVRGGEPKTLKTLFHEVKLKK